jgi:hypothetical protein
MAMKMAVESMEILPGALPRPGREPEQRLLSPETWLRCDGGGGTFLQDSGLFLGFLASGQYIGERAEPGAGQGVTTSNLKTNSKCPLYIPPQSQDHIAIYIT